MKPPRRSILSMLDDTVRWTGMPARVAAQMSNGRFFNPEHRPLRWSPIWPIAFSSALLAVSLAWPPVLDDIPLGGMIGITTGFWGAILTMVPGIHMSGPLGKSSLQDDEREAALRNASFLFCLGLLAVLNCLGQPILMIVSQFQHWQTVRSASVAASTFMLNATLFGCLPTLYASWKLRELPRE
jgi:hypothetical protein